MAKQTHIEMVDDIDPTHTADVTVQFSLDGHHYEIDLANSNADKLRDTLSPWIAAARKTIPGRRRITTLNHDNSESKAIRQWAESQGMSVSARGRLSAEIVAAYRNRHNLTDRQRAEKVFDLKEKAMQAAQAAMAAEVAASGVTE